MVETFDYRQLLEVGGGGGIEFSLTKDAMLEWKLRKTWLPLRLHNKVGGGGWGIGAGAVITKDGSHSFHRDLWVSY